MNEEERAEILSILVRDEDCFHRVYINEDWKINLKKNFDKRICDIEDCENDETYREFFHWCSDRLKGDMWGSVFRTLNPDEDEDEFICFKEKMYNVIEKNIDEFFDMLTNIQLYELYECAEYLIDK